LGSGYVKLCMGRLVVGCGRVCGAETKKKQAVEQPESMRTERRTTNV